MMVIREVQVMFSTNLKRIRTGKKPKITQDHIADALGVTQQTVGRWENGTGSPDPDTLRKLAIFLEVTLDELCFDYDENNRIQYEKLTQDEKLIDIMKKAEKNYGLKLVFDKTADLGDKELEKLSKIIDIIIDEE